MNNEDSHSEQLFGAADYINALDSICSLARHSLLVFEKDFSHTGFDSGDRAEILRNYLLANPFNRLQLLAHDTRPLSQSYPRLMTLLRQFGHNMFIYQTPKHLKHLTEAFAIADEAHFVRRFHFDGALGVLAYNDSSNARLLKANFMEMWNVSSPNLHTSTFHL